jgi:hypothetical protein
MKQKEKEWRLVKNILKVIKDTFFAGLNKPNCIHGSDMFHHYLQLRKPLD